MMKYEIFALVYYMRESMLQKYFSFFFILENFKTFLS